MRLRDREEIEAVALLPLGDLRDAQLARGEFIVAGTDDGEPVALVHFVPVTPACLQVNMIATDRFGAVALPLTKHVVREIVPRLKAGGYRRCECRCIAGYTEAHRWLELMGARRARDPVLGFGRNGESFIEFAWIN